MDTDTSRPTDSPLISRHIRDIEELNEFVSGWNVDFRQLDRGQLTCDLLQLGTGGRLLTTAAFDRRIDQQGVAPEGAFTFAVPKIEAPHIVWRSRRVQPGSMIVYRPGSEIDGASRPGFSVFTLSIAIPLFETACVRAGRADLVEAAHEFEIVTPDVAVLSHFVKAMVLTARPVETRRKASAQARLLDWRLCVLTDMAVKVLATSKPAPKTHRTSHRPAVMRRALDHLQKRGAVTVASICEAAGVSERTLQYAFRERFDIAPKQYIQTTRLQRVRRRLRTCDPSTTRIADIANELGFWHMGQFAADYRRQFGELPSETLQRRSPTH